MDEGKTHWADRVPGKWFLGFILPALLLFVWWLGIRSGSAVIPSFSDVFHVLLHPLETPPDIYSRSLAFSFFMTMLRLAIGFGIGLITAIPLGLLAGRSRVLHRILNPAVQTARPLNPIVLLPISMVLFGISSLASITVGGENAWKHDIMDQVQLAMIFILWWGAFFPIFISTVHGVRAVRSSYLETMGLLGASKTQVFVKVIIPHALPSIANGIRIAMGVTWLVIIAAEIFPGTRSGLGYMLCTACKTSDYEYTFAALIVIGSTGYLIDYFLHRFEIRVSHWQSAER